MIWNLIAKFVARPAVRTWLINRAWKTPYTHIEKNGETYMQRFWLFNPYEFGPKKTWRRNFPSIRLHKIMLEDRDRHSHSHPWDCRTIILDGWYVEERLEETWVSDQVLDKRPGAWISRIAGTTATLGIDDYHRIVKISEGGVWTMFITWKYQGTWGFWVDGRKVKWREYLGLD